MPWFKEGEKNKNEVFFQRKNMSAIFYIRLFNDTPVKEDTIATLLGEPSGNGYEPQPLNADDIDWPTLAEDSGDWKITGKLVTFSASGSGWGPVTSMVLATSGNGGEAVFWSMLSQARTVNAGENLLITPSNKELSI